MPPLRKSRPPPLFLGAYRPHKVVTGAHMELCLTCGNLVNKEALKGPLGVRCPGRSGLPPFARQAVDAGCFDAPILADLSRLGELATAQGWLHPADRRFVLEPD